MKRRMIKILSAIFQAMDIVLCKLHLKRPVVVIFMDGGICSQMLVYLHGQYYAESGVDVYYDTRWFDVCGKDHLVYILASLSLKRCGRLCHSSSCAGGNYGYIDISLRWVN